MTGMLPLKAVIEELAHLGDMSRQIMNDFSQSSKKVDDLKFKIFKVMLVLNALKKEMANPKMELEVVRMFRPLSNKM